MKITAALAVLLAALSAAAADKSKPERPDAKFLAAVDKAIAAAQEKAVPTPKLLKLAKVLIKKGRLIRANEVAALIARKKTEEDLAVAKKINTAVAQFKGIVGTWEINNNVRHFTPDGDVVESSGYRVARWEHVSGDTWKTMGRGQTREITVLGLTCAAKITRDTSPHSVGKVLHGKRAK